MRATASSSSGMPAVTTTPSMAAPAARARCTMRRPPSCSFHRYGSRKSELNWMARPGSSNVESSATRSVKMSSVTCPPPASSAQWPALAAAATIFASTVVGVMPASRIGERPVILVKDVSTTTRPSGSVTGLGANADHAGCTSGAAPGVSRFRWPPREDAAMMPTPCPRSAGVVMRVRRSPGPRSRIQSAPASTTPSMASTQSTESTRIFCASSRARAASSPQRCAQASTSSTASFNAG
ncbi:unannotated protein [freshwater metagenome]|uniref:Unannotated protein n=1 Tax=freshwater metagenome TaxID=449393 RepID=A0A6J7H8Z7_9ZZZZ